MKALFLVSFQHFYDDNFFNNEFSTHYIVLAYKHLLSPVVLYFHMNNIMNTTGWKLWMKILNNDLVHFNAKAYFMNVALDF